VLLPKALGLLLEWKRAKATGDYLGGIRTTLGVLYETVYSMLIAPIFMITQTIGAIQILAGIDSGWKAQKRDDGALGFFNAMSFARWHTLLGLISGAIVWYVSPALLAWMSPVILGLVLAGPMSWLTSRPAGPVSRWLLATLEDKAPPPILSAATHQASEWSQRIRDLSPPMPALPKAA
jgi:membrane glycosyltransferase